MGNKKRNKSATSEKVEREQEVRNFCQIADTHHRQRNDHAHAFAYYLLALQITPDDTTRAHLIERSSFNAVWTQLTKQLMNINNIDILMKLYEQACEVVDFSHHIHYVMAGCLYKLGCFTESIHLYLKSLRLKPDSVAAQARLERSCAEVVSPWHFAMLNDEKRNRVFQQALEKAVAQLPKEIQHFPLLDIGCGTGILSMLAARCNSSLKIDACDDSSIMHLVATEAVRFNNFSSDQIKTFHCRSNEHESKQRYSLIFTEIFDAGFFGEGCFETLIHAKKSLLVPDQGRILPAKVVLKCVLVKSDDLRQKHTCYMRDHGLLLTSGAVNTYDNDASNASLDRIKTTQLEPYSSDNLCDLVDYEILTGETDILKVDFNSLQQLERLASGKVELKVDFAVTKRSDSVDAVLLWFQLDLLGDGQHVIDTSKEGCWEQAIFPLRVESGLSAVADDVISCNFLCSARGLQLRSISQNKLYQDQLNLLTPDVRHHLAIHEESMLRCNDNEFMQACFQAINHVASCASQKVLFLSASFDPVVLRILDQKNLEVHQLVNDSDCFTAFETLYKQLGVPISLHRNLDDALDHDYDIIVAYDIIRRHGTLVKGMLDDLTMVKNQQAGVKIVPDCIKMMAQCVSSETLLSKVMVIDSQDEINSRTCGLHLGEALMNQYCFSHYEGFNLSKIKHTLLTTEFIAFDNLLASSKDKAKTQTAKVIENGQINSVVYWFELTVLDHSFKTYLSPQWLQSAFVLSRTPKQPHVSIGQQVVVRSCIEDDALWFVPSAYMCSD